MLTDEENIKKRLELLEEKVDKIRHNIIMMSFFTDLKIIESTVHRCKLHGIKIDPDLLSSLAEFKKHLYGDKNIFEIGRKYMDLSEKYFALRKEIYGEDAKTGEVSKEELEELLKSYM
jgi:hypothetical protein